MNAPGFAKGFPKGPCAQIVYTLALKYLYTDYSKAKVNSIWVHGPLGFGRIADIFVPRVRVLASTNL